MANNQHHLRFELYIPARNKTSIVLQLLAFNRHISEQVICDLLVRKLQQLNYIRNTSINIIQ